MTISEAMKNIKSLRNKFSLQELIPDPDSAAFVKMLKALDGKKRHFYPDDEIKNYQAMNAYNLLVCGANFMDRQNGNGLSRGQISITRKKFAAMCISDSDKVADRVLKRLSAMGLIRVKSIIGYKDGARGYLLIDVVNYNHHATLTKRTGYHSGYHSTKNGIPLCAGNGAILKENIGVEKVDGIPLDQKRDTTRDTLKELKEPIKEYLQSSPDGAEISKGKGRGKGKYKCTEEGTRLLEKHATAFKTRMDKPYKILDHYSKLADNVIKEIGLEEGEDCLRKFFTSKNPYYRRNHYDFGLFYTNLNKLINEP